MVFRGSGVIVLEDLRRPKSQAVVSIETFPPGWLARLDGLAFRGFLKF